MIIVELPIKIVKIELVEMVDWCDISCPTDFYYFPPNENLEEKAKFWFYNNVDAFAFKFKFGLT